MINISMLDLRTNSKKLLKELKKKENITLTYRGKAIGTIQPIVEESDWIEDPLSHFINNLPSSPKKTRKSSITNSEIDSILYGI
jgi:antitoxin (DNA-binding transcriptional repressor) of toxin-antitoxin stability system